MPRVTSLRQLADQLQLSHATVSAALAGKSTVKPATRDRVVAAAEAFGYRANPLASALMGELRRSRGGVFRGVLGLLAPSASAIAHPSAAAIEKGARDRAAETGFELAQIRIDARDPAPGRLGAILHARGIVGVITLPGISTSRLDELDWMDLCGVHAGHAGENTALHVVQADDAAAMRLIFAQLRHAGRRRPALVLSGHSGAAHVITQHAAYLSCLLADACREQCQLPAPPLPFFFDPGLPPPPSALANWLRAGAHDAVISDTPVVWEWIRSAPELRRATQGFCLLEREPGGGPCGGVDPRHELVGSRAVDLLREQLLRHETGRPAVPLTTLVPPCWVASDEMRNPAPASEHIAAALRHQSELATA
ncbi:MAG: LacI family DNA-binding transcriptional regulator [Opitutaceae bacterium]|nr:LacI family DNA-binding transcriptional regulator [Opitutaceae bacterium]